MPYRVGLVLAAIIFACSIYVNFSFTVSDTA
ncbi:MAG: hypothetical protein QOK44_4296, partial [Betaproteobacteria bacterium]|nr:hypothetical protein [Betaproteobacteria bacterium]